MAFLNLDLYLVDTYCAFFAAAQADPDFYIGDVFADRPEAERVEIAAYIAGLTVTSNLRDRDSERRYLYVLPSFPLLDLPFPQIGVFMGPEETQEFFLGLATGAAPKPVMNVQGATVAYDQTEGYYAGFNYRSDIVCNTREEVIWLSRLCQRAVVEKIIDLDSLGVTEPRISLNELQLDREQFPAMVEARALTLAGKVLQTWTKRTPAGGTYQTGINKALEG